MFASPPAIMKNGVCCPILRQEALEILSCYMSPPFGLGVLGTYLKNISVKQLKNRRYLIAPSVSSTKYALIYNKNTFIMIVTSR